MFQNPETQLFIISTYVSKEIFENWTSFGMINSLFASFPKLKPVNKQNPDQNSDKIFVKLRFGTLFSRHFNG